jgi:hypothetical protein
MIERIYRPGSTGVNVRLGARRPCNQAREAEIERSLIFEVILVGRYGDASLYVGPCGRRGDVSKQHGLLSQLIVSMCSRRSIEEVIAWKR